MGLNWIGLSNKGGISDSFQASGFSVQKLLGPR